MVPFLDCNGLKHHRHRDHICVHSSSQVFGYGHCSINGDIHFWAGELQGGKLRLCVVANIGLIVIGVGNGFVAVDIGLSDCGTRGQAVKILHGGVYTGAHAAVARVHVGHAGVWTPSTVSFCGGAIINVEHYTLFCAHQLHRPGGFYLLLVGIVQWIDYPKVQIFGHGNGAVGNHGCGVVQRRGFRKSACSKGAQRETQ